MVSIVAETGMAAGRAAGIAVAAALVAPSLAALLHRRPLLWVAAGLIVAMPGLVVGYAASTVPLIWLQSQLAREVLYPCLLWAQLCPVAAAPVWWLGRDPDARAAHCRRLLQPATARWQRWRLASAGWLASGGRARLIGALAVASLAFAEFEIASLLGLDSWTVWLFDSQVGGLPLEDALLASWPPLAVQGLLWAGIALLLRRRGWRRGEALRAGPWPAQAWLLLAAVGVVLPPLVLIVVDALPDLTQAVVRYPLLQPTIDSLVIAGLAAGLGLGLAIALGARRRPPTGAAPAAGRWLGALALLAALPGLTGSLLVGLILLALFSWLLPGLADSMLPWLAGALLACWPWALLLGSALPRRRLALLCPTTTGRRWLAWRQQGRWWLLAAAFLAGRILLDPALGGLLAPIDHPAVAGRLYNFMHYGRSDALSAMALLAWLGPLSLVALAWGVGEWRCRRRTS